MKKILKLIFFVYVISFPFNGFSQSKMKFRVLTDYVTLKNSFAVIKDDWKEVTPFVEREMQIDITKRILIIFRIESGKHDTIPIFNINNQSKIEKDSVRLLTFESTDFHGGIVKGVLYKRKTNKNKASYIYFSEHPILTYRMELAKL
ncbi:MAG: hypothetical protein QM737_15990 [Ferruginibacter sp.]